MSARDHRRAFGGEASALEVDVEPGVRVAGVARAIRRALAVRHDALSVETAHARLARASAVVRDGLAWNRRALTLVLAGAALAMAAAMGAGAWQRRVAFGQLRVMGWRSMRLWRALVWEAALVLGTGCVIGGAAASTASTSRTAGCSTSPGIRRRPHMPSSRRSRSACSCSRARCW